MVKLTLLAGGFPLAVDDLETIQNLAVNYVELLHNYDSENSPRVVTGCYYTYTGSTTTISKGLISYLISGQKQLIEFKETILTIVGENNISLQLFTSNSVPVTYEDSTPGVANSQQELYFMAVPGAIPSGGIGFSYPTLKYSRVDEVGEIKDYSISSSDIADQFDSSGKGRGIRTGWAIANGQNGTPDLSGRVAVGQGILGSNTYTIGDSGGEEKHQLSVAEMPNHRLKITAYLDGTDGSNNGRNPNPEASANGNGDFYTDYIGGDQPHNNMQPYYVTLKIMKIK